MDSGVSACSPGSTVETPDSKRCRTTLVTEGLEDYPFWSSAEEEGLVSPPLYTDGPSRVIKAKVGTKDCLALLLTPDLVGTLNQITNDTLALERREGVLEKIELQITDLSCKKNTVEGAIRNPKYHDRAEEMQLALEILELKQEEADEHKTQLKNGLAPIESRLNSSRNQTQDIFEDALVDAGLLDLLEPASPSITHDVDDDVSIGGYSDAPSVYEGIEPTPEQQSLREARLEVIANYESLSTHQARFDDRHADYERKLADFQRSEAGCEETRTQFEHRHIQHVRDLTRDLISAEQGYRIAKAKARTLESHAQPFSSDSHLGYLANDGGRRSDDASAEPNSDRERIEAWTRGVLNNHDGEVLEDKEPLDVDDWEAKPVEIMDSVSAIDCDEYMEEIRDWKEQCRMLRKEASAGHERKTDGL